METVFISSTIHDLKDLRDALDNELTRHGYKTLLSEKGTIPVDSSKHTYDDCIDAARNCDFLIAIFDGRLGGIVPTSGKSITVTEVEAALDAGKQVYVFVRQSVWDAMEVLRPYFKDRVHFRASKIVEDKRVFETLDVIRKRVTGNWIFQFNLPTDIIRQLSAQRGFQLRESSNKDTESLDKIIARKTLELFPDDLIEIVCGGLQLTAVNADAVYEFCESVEAFHKPSMCFAGRTVETKFGKFMRSASALIAKSTIAFHQSINPKLLTLRDSPNVQGMLAYEKIQKEVSKLAIQTWQAWNDYYALVRKSWPELISELHAPAQISKPRAATRIKSNKRPIKPKRPKRKGGP